MSKKIPVWVPPIVVFLTLICLYGFTASTRLTWANSGYDGGDFLAAILTGGIPHPTGYPAYMLLGRLFQWIPVGEPYFRVVLLSFLPAAVAGALFSLWINYLYSWSILPGMVGGLIWGMSALLWSQSVIVEVYGLQALFTVLALWWATLLFQSTREHKKILVFLALVFGFSLGNHITIIFLLPVILAGLIDWVAKTHCLKFGLLQVGAVLIGSLVYVYLPIQARGFPPINWGNPQTAEGFLWVISGQPYQSLLGSITLNTVSDRFLASATILGQQVGFAGLVLGVMGAVHLFQQNRKMGYVGLWFFASYLIFSIVYNTADSKAYLIPVIMLFAGWIGYSLNALRGLYWKRISIFGVAAFLVFFELVLRTPGTINQIDPRSGYSASEFAETTLSQLPENGIILTSSDLDSFPLWAYHFGYGFRKDLFIIALPLTQYDWYRQTLTHVYPSLKLPDTSQIWEDQIGTMNENHVICKGEPQAANQINITFICSNGQKIEFVSDP